MGDTVGSKKWLAAVKQLAEANKQLKDEQLSNHIKLKHIEKLELEVAKLNERWTKLQSGSLVYTLDSNGFVDNMVNIPNDFKTTYPQELPKGFGTALYHKNRFIKIDNGVIVIDEEQYKKYIGGI